MPRHFAAVRFDTPALQHVEMIPGDHQVRSFSPKMFVRLVATVSTATRPMIALAWFTYCDRGATIATAIEELAVGLGAVD
jgi:hypothetical protein